MDYESRTESGLNDNSVLVDPTGETYNKKTWLGESGKVRSMIQLETDALLTEKDVCEGFYYSRKEGLKELDDKSVRNNAHEDANKKSIYAEERTTGLSKRALFIAEQTRQNNSFDYISKKQEVIKENISKINDTINKFGGIDKNTLEYELMQSYLNLGYITEVEIAEEILYYFKSQAKMAYAKANSPFSIENYGGETYIVQDYHDLYRHLGEQEQKMLAYGMNNNLLNDTELTRLEEILKKSGNDLENFCSKYINDDLLNIYVRNNLYV